MDEFDRDDGIVAYEGQISGNYLIWTAVGAIVLIILIVFLVKHLAI